MGNLKLRDDMEKEYDEVLADHALQLVNNLITTTIESIANLDTNNRNKTVLLKDVVANYTANMMISISKPEDGLFAVSHHAFTIQEQIAGVFLTIIDKKYGEQYIPKGETH